jgi:uncharacterized protein YjbI with pentapeptide repeats
MSAFWERFRKNPLNWIFITTAIIIFSLLAWSAYLHYVEGRDWAEWTGFGKYTGDVPPDDRGKTLWDWMELLIIPAILSVGAILFNKSQKDNEQRLAIDRQREDGLQSYLDNMAELILKENLIEKKGIEHDPTVDVARLRTTTTLRILDTERKNIVFRFLRDANLADFLLRGASLSEVELPNVLMHEISLQSASLRRANLRGASVRSADLREANLWKANLSLANLSRARLNDANLSEATLQNAKLMRANLNGANIKGAVLRGANLTDARVTTEQLAQVYSLEGTIMPDGLKYDGRLDWMEAQPPEE